MAQRGVTQTSGGGRYDDVVVGAGHNGLTAAAYLARAGRRVLVLERLDHVGGAAVSAAPFPGVEARLSRYSYLVSLLPRRVVEDLDLDVRLVRRRYASYTPLPTTPLGACSSTPRTPRRLAPRSSRLWVMTRTSLPGNGSTLAWRRWHSGCGPPCWSHCGRPTTCDGWSPTTSCGTPSPRPRWARCCADTFADDTVRGIVATDALIGTFADLDDPSLAQNICFLYHLMGGGTGDWDVPVGGMGAVTDALAKAAVGAGAELVTDADVVSVDGDGEVVWRLGDREHRARGHVHAGLAPARAGRAAGRLGLGARLR